MPNPIDAIGQAIGQAPGQYFDSRAAMQKELAEAWDRSYKLGAQAHAAGQNRIAAGYIPSMNVAGKGLGLPAIPEVVGGTKQVEGPRPSPGFRGPMPGVRAADWSNPQTGGGLAAAFGPKPPDKLEEVSPGATLFNPKTGKGVFTAPEKAYHGMTMADRIQLAQLNQTGALTRAQMAQAAAMDRMVYGQSQQNNRFIAGQFNQDTRQGKALGARAKVNWGHVTDWEDSIQKAATAFDVDPHLIRSVMLAESNGNAKAHSGVGAIGLMQLMPDTARGLGVDPDIPEANIMGGAKYLRQMLDKFGGDTEKAVAAYNAGPGAVEKAGGVPNFQETQNYVQRVAGFYGAAPPAAPKPAKPPRYQTKNIGGRLVRIDLDDPSSKVDLGPAGSPKNNPIADILGGGGDDEVGRAIAEALSQKKGGKK